MNSDPFRRRIAMALGGLSLFLVVDVSLGKVGRVAEDWAAERAGRDAVTIERGYRVQHPYYHHDLIAAYDGVGAFGPIRYTVRTNSLALRDGSTREIPTRTDAFRILLMGDSFTEGLGVDYDSTFAGLLADRYASAGIDVVNGGVVSYSPAIYWKKIEYLLERLALQVDAVVLFLDLADILDEAFSYRIDSMGRVVDAPEIPRGAIDAWTWNSLTYRSVGKARRMLLSLPPLPRCGINDVPDPECLWMSPAMDLYGREGFRRADEHMTRLAELLRARRIPLTIVVYPWADQLKVNDRSSPHVTYWRQWAKRERADFIELFTPFFAEADSLGTEEAITRYFIQDDVHWSASGHRLVAESFAPQFATTFSTSRDESP